MSFQALLPSRSLPPVLKNDNYHDLDDDDDEQHDEQHNDDVHLPNNQLAVRLPVPVATNTP